MIDLKEMQLLTFNLKKINSVLHTRDVSSSIHK